MSNNKVATARWTADLPKKWRDGSIITLVGEVGKSGFASNIVVNREILQETLTIEEYAALQIDFMRQDIGEIQILNERRIKLKEIPALQRVLRFAVEEHAIQQFQTIMLKDDTVYAVTGTATVEDFENSVYAFNEFVESFEFTD